MTTISHLLRTTALAGSILTILALSTTNASQTELPSEMIDVTSRCAVKAMPPTPPQSSRWWWPFTWGTSKPVTPLVPSLTEDKGEKKEDGELKGSSEGTMSSAPSVTPSTSEKEATSEIDTGMKKISSAASSDDFFLLESETQENAPTISFERLSSSRESTSESTSALPLPEKEAEKKGESGQEVPSSFLEGHQEENNLPLNSITLPDQTPIPSPTQNSGDVKPQLTPEKSSNTFTSQNRPQEAKKQLKKKKAKNHPNQSKKNRKKRF